MGHRLIAKGSDVDVRVCRRPTGTKYHCSGMDGKPTSNDIWRDICSLETTALNLEQVSCQQLELQQQVGPAAAGIEAVERAVVVHRMGQTPSNRFVCRAESCG